MNARTEAVSSIEAAQLYERRKLLRELLFQARGMHERVTARLSSTSDPETLRLVRLALGNTRILVNILEAELHGAVAAPPIAGHTLSLVHGGGR